MPANREEILLLGVDVGTSRTKAVLFGASTGALSRAHQSYALHHPAPGFFELDPEEVWTAVASCLRQIGQANRRKAIRALALSVQGEAVIPISKEGRPLARSPVSADTRGAPYLERLGKHFEARQISQITGQPPTPLSSLTKIMWWREHCPDLYQQARKFYCYGEFILSRLGVEPAIDESMASRTMLYDIGRKIWSPELLGQAELASSRLAPVVPSGTVVGKMSDVTARSFGLPPGIEIVVGGHDQACAAFGAGVVDSETALYSIGTTEVIAAVFDHPSDSLLEKNVPCYPHVVPGKYLALVGSQTGARLLEWFAQTFVGVADAEPRPTARPIENLTERIDDQPGDLMLLPFFAGSGSVRNDPTAKGALIGLTFETGLEDIVKALLEGITYEQAVGLSHVPEIDGRIKMFRCGGGGVRSPAWLRIKANIFGRPLETLEIEETACLGAALVAGCGIGVFDSPRMAVTQIVRPGQRFEPDPKKHWQYRQKLELYSRLANEFARPI